MNYFIDTEFHEYFKKCSRGFGSKSVIIPTIDLISIGIVSEDNRELYLLNKECNLDDIWKNSWLQDNVLYPIYCTHFSGDVRNVFPFSKKIMKQIFKSCGKTKKEIKSELWKFFFPLEYFVKLLAETLPNTNVYIDGNYICKDVGGYYSQEELVHYLINGKLDKNKFDLPVFYGYFAEYDWVAICQNIYGKMNDFPKLLPMYCRNIKQMLDELDDKLRNIHGVKYHPTNSEKGCYFKKSLCEAEWFPENKNEHLAIDDARWHKKIYEFIKNIENEHNII